MQGAPWPDPPIAPGPSCRPLHAYPSSSPGRAIDAVDSTRASHQPSPLDTSNQPLHRGR